MKRIKAEGQAPEGPWGFCLMGKETQADRVPIMHYYARMGLSTAKGNKQKGNNKQGYVCMCFQSCTCPLFNRKLGSKPFST